MPNWCENHFSVDGPKEAVDEFVLALQTNLDVFEYPPKLSFNKLIPIPPEQEENWYDWNIQNWGTKWDIDNVEPYDWNESIIDGVKRSALYYDFDTAWGPPIEFVKSISKKFPELSIYLKYHEPGMAFAGSYTALVNNEYEENEYYDMVTSPQEYRKYVEEEFGWEFDDEGEEY